MTLSHHSYVPSRQIVNVVGGRRKALAVAVGDDLWTLAGTKTVVTTVNRIASQSVRDLVEVETEAGIFRVGRGHRLAIAGGWVAAGESAGHLVAWTPARKLCRERLTIKPGYDFGYMVGALCADGTTGKNYISLVVNDEWFARKFADSITVVTGLKPDVEAVSRPSGYLARDLPGFRVRVVSSYLADLSRQYVGGDAHHQRQHLPRVVLRDIPTFEGFLDGYVDGDGCLRKNANGRLIVSKNVPFLVELAQVIGARFTPSTVTASQLYIADSWLLKRGFTPEHHPEQLIESAWSKVLDVRPLKATGAKPFTGYTFTCAPHPTFLIGGHLTGPGVP